MIVLKGKNALGGRIRELREQAGMSQLELANKLGISRTAIARYEGGVSSPSRRLKELADALDVSTDYLLGSEDEFVAPYRQTGLGKRIKFLRDRAGMDKRTLAVRCGVATRAVSSWEDEISAPSLTAVTKMAEIFNVSTDYILGRVHVIDEVPEGSQLVTHIVNQLYEDDPALLDKLKGCNIYLKDFDLNPTEKAFLKSNLEIILRAKGVIK